MNPVVATSKAAGVPGLFFVHRLQECPHQGGGVCVFGKVIVVCVSVFLVWWCRMSVFLVYLIEVALLSPPMPW